jgi:hypothetical protein
MDNDTEWKNALADTASKVEAQVSFTEQGRSYGYALANFLKINLGFAYYASDS